MAIIIAGIIDLAPGDADRVIREAQPLIAAALCETGCCAYSWAIDPSRPGRVCVFEEWDSEEDLAAHFAGEPYRKMGDKLRSGDGMLGFSVKKYRSDLSEPVYDDAGLPRADFFATQP